MQAFKMNQNLYLDGVKFRVVRALNEHEVQVENTETGELSKHYVYSLMQAYVAGTLKTSAARRHELRLSLRSKPAPARMDGMSQSSKKDSLRRIDILTRLRNLGSFEKSKAELHKDLELIAIQRGEHRPVHESTVYRWRKKFLAAERDVQALFAELDKRGGRGKPYCEFQQARSIRRNGSPTG